MTAEGCRPGFVARVEAIPFIPRPFTEDYVAGHASRFNGRIRQVTIEVK